MAEAISKGAGEEGKMRIAAGILILFGAFLPHATIIREVSVLGWYLLMGFLFLGVWYTFKRKHWWLCLTASVLSLTILPVIFVCLRKREWES